MPSTSREVYFSKLCEKAWPNTEWRTTGGEIMNICYKSEVAPAFELLGQDRHVAEMNACFTTDFRN